MLLTGHMADYGQLLTILLPEVGFIRPHEEEQPLHNVHNPLEMTGTRRALPVPVQTSQVVGNWDETSEQLALPRRKKHVAADLL